MSEIPSVLAWPSGHAQRHLRQMGRTVHVCDATPAQADHRYSEQRVIRQTIDADGTVHLIVAGFIPRSAIRVTEMPLSQAPPTGVYALEIVVTDMLTISPGVLGPVSLEPGLYIYIGSARKGLPSRLGRHAASDKKLRWHVDYLTTIAAPHRALIWPWTAGRECTLAREIAGLGQVITGFGASDCQCSGHLIRLESREAAWWHRLSQMPPPVAAANLLANMMDENNPSADLAHVNHD